MNYEIEQKKKTFLQLTTDFLEKFGEYTYPTDNQFKQNENYTSLPDKNREEALPVLNDIVKKIKVAHEDIVLTARAKLKC